MDIYNCVAVCYSPTQRHFHIGAVADMINQNQQAVCSRYPADYVTVAFCRDDAAADRFVEHFTAVLRHENIEPRTYD